MTLRSDERLDARLACIPYAKERPRASAPSASTSADDTAWWFWATGADSAPPLVQRCLSTVRQTLGEDRVTVLDEQNYRDHVRLPPHIESLHETVGWTHFSDLLRLHLLAEHGGSWIDATVMLSAPPPPEIAGSDFFAFTRPEDPFLMSSWFLRASAGDPLVIVWRDLLVRYWADNSELRDYFLMHFMFETAVTAYPALREEWLRVPVHSFEPAHRVQAVLGEPAGSVDLQSLLSQSWIHKLTYKLPVESFAEGTVAAALVDGVSP